MHSNTSDCSHSTTSQSNSIETTSIGIQTETETWDDNIYFLLTPPLWNTGFAITEVKQQTRSLSIELNILKVSLRCANRSRANAKVNANPAESKRRFENALLLI